MKKVVQSNAPFNINFDWGSNPQEVKVELSKVSPTYCLAKWAHSTIHFQLGMTHSCYNLPPHKIPTESLSQNPSSLHNTPIKLEQRHMMIQGTRPPDCAYCWNIEDLNNDNKSDRIIQSSGTWAYPHANEIYESGLGERINPRYLEVSFSNVCNFKCSYCNPQHSSSWWDEIKQYGPYQDGFKQDQPEVLEENNNPFIKAFNDWWPILKKDLKVFRITGGEPLLSKNTWQILEDIERDPLPHLHLSINSNLGVSDKAIDKLIKKLKILIQKKSVARVTLFTSIEATGKQAEYIRYGLNSEKFFKNIEKILAELPDIRISIMATFCALSIFSYYDLVKKILEIRKLDSSGGHALRLGLSTNYLRFPEYLSAHILSDSMNDKMNDIFDFMKMNEFHIANYKIGFTKNEIFLFDNVRQWMAKPIEKSLKSKYQEEFIRFFTEHDRRRGTNLFDSFPELKNLFPHS